jgi:hypothetical protein
MAAELLVANQIEDGKKIIDQLVRDGFEVTVAFWVKTEEGLWRLYIASPSVDNQRPGKAAPALYDSLRKIPDSSVQFSEIRLINAANPMAQDAVALRNHPAIIPNEYPGKRLGHLAIEESFIYPRSMEVTIYGLSYKGDPTHLVHLSFTPHNPNSRMLVGREGEEEYPADTSMTWVVTVPEGSVLERDDLGRLVLAWDLDGGRIQSDAGEALVYARRGTYGFHIVREPTLAPQVARQG